MTLSAAMGRQETEAVGATVVAQAEVVWLEREVPVPLMTRERLVLGSDGAMVLLVGGE